jgi:hypothetical protein
MCFSRFLVLLALGLAVAGCQRVNQQKTEKLGPGDVVAPFIVDAPSRNQEVTVTVSPNGAAVDVYIVLEKDRAAAEQALQERQAPKDVLAGKQKVDKETTLTATVPAKNAYAVLLGNTTKEATVAITLKGK